MSCHRWPGKLALAFAAIALSCSSFGQTVSAPGLTLSATGTNRFVVSITNAEPATNYTLERRMLLDKAHSWNPYFRGAVGQSNFIVDAGGEMTGLLRARPGIDWSSNYLGGAL